MFSCDLIFHIYDLKQGDYDHDMLQWLRKPKSWREVFELIKDIPIEREERDNTGKVIR